MTILRIKEIMAKKGITGKDFSSQLGISETSMSLIVQGKQIPRAELLLRIASHLDINLPDLFIDTKEKDKSISDLLDENKRNIELIRERLDTEDK